MGSQFLSKLRKAFKYNRNTPYNMKLFVVCALFALAAAEPEADPQVLLGAVPYVADAHHSAGLVHHYNGAVTPDDTLSVKLAKAQHLTAKANEYLLKGYVPHVAYTAPVTYGLPLTYGLHHGLVKREAEAEPEADPQVFYNTYGYYPTGYTAPVVTKPVVYTKPVVKTYTAPLTYTTPLTYGYPYTYGLHHGLVKRDAEAEPEADAQYFYNTYGYGLNKYFYNNYYNPYSVYSPYTAYPYVY